MLRLSTTITRLDATRASSRLAWATSAKWCAATRVAASSKLPSANGSSSAKQITSGSIPGDGVAADDLEARFAQPARDVAASVATSIAVAHRRAHSTTRSRSAPLRWAGLCR